MREMFSILLIINALLFTVAFDASISFRTGSDQDGWGNSCFRQDAAAVGRNCHLSEAFFSRLRLAGDDRPEFCSV